MKLFTGIFIFMGDACCLGCKENSYVYLDTIFCFTNECIYKNHGFIKKRIKKNFQDETENKIIKEKIEKNIVKKVSGCWEYIGPKNTGGYGIVGYYNKRPLSAHRASYLIYVGNIPDKMFICHHCDFPSCCNPDHLFLGDHKANIQDMIKKGRAAWQKNKNIKMENQ